MPRADEKAMQSANPKSCIFTHKSTDINNQCGFGTVMFALGAVTHAWHGNLARPGRLGNFGSSKIERYFQGIQAILNNPGYSNTDSDGHAYSIIEIIYETRKYRQSR